MEPVNPNRKFMRRIFAYILLSILMMPVFAAKPLFMREVAVGGNSKIKLTTKLQFYIPASCAGYRLLHKHSKVYPATEYKRHGSLVKIYFSARSGDKFHLAFYKNKIENPKQKQISGVLRRVRKFNGKNVRNFQMFKDLWEQGDVEGSRFEKRIYSGWNPFGPKGNSLHWYSAFINIPTSGKWTFFAASTDASFILIDGKLVVNSPYRKWVRSGQEGKIRGSIELTKGIHHLDYLHANNNSSYCYAIAAILPPGTKKRKYHIIPETSYTKILTATAGPLQTFSRRDTSDFKWQSADMIEIEEQRMFVVHFKARFKKFLQWSLGEKAQEFNYFYFREGEYPVSLKCNLGEISQNISVNYQYMLKPIGSDKLKKYIKEALTQEKQYGIQREGYAFLAAALVKMKMLNEAEIFYKRLLAKQNSKSVPPEITFKLFNDLVFHKLLKEERLSEAEKQLRKLLKMIHSPQLLSTANLSYAELLFYYLGKNKEAEKRFNNIKINNLTTDDQKHRYRLLEADLTLMAKGFELAEKLYAKIKTSKAASIPERRKQLLISGSLIAIRNCYILKKYESALEHIEKLESIYPEIRLKASYLLLKARILDKLKRPQRAAQILLRLLETNPSINTTAAANLELTQFYLKKEQYLSARQRLNNILKIAPRTREAAEATALLKKLVREGVIL